MAYGQGRVYLRGKSYWLQYCYQGTVIREPAKTRSRDEALAALARKQAGVKGVTTVAQGERTVVMLTDRVLLKYKTKKQASISTARGTAKAWLAALGETTPLQGLTIERIAEVTESWEDADYAPATINLRLSFLQLGFRLVDLQPRLDLRDLRLPLNNVRDAYLPPDGFARLHAAAVAADPDLADYLSWLYQAGMRRGEARRLEASWVDRHRRVLTIPGRVQKHRKDRVIPLSGPLWAAIDARLRRVQPGVPWLFHRDGAPIGDIRKIWRSLCVAAELTNVRPHDLRRSACTNLLDWMSMKDAMVITGHRTMATFMRYQQVPDARLREKLDAMPQPSWSPRAA
jgi:integrase